MAASGHPAGTANTPHEYPMVHVVYDAGGMTVAQGSYAPDGRMLAAPQGVGKVAMAGHP